MIPAVHVLALALLALHASDILAEPEATTFLIILVVLTVARGGLGAIDLVRALIYRNRRFPALRAAADALGDQGRAGHLYLILTGAPGRPETTTRVLQAAIAEAGRHGAAATLVATVVEEADRRLIKQVFAAAAPPPNLRLVLVPEPAGPRGAGLAAALRAVSRTMPEQGSAVVVLDWRTLLTADCLPRCLPFLRLHPDVSSIATDQIALADGGPLRRAAASLRAAERHQAASSLALAARASPIARPMTLHRAPEVLCPEVIHAIERGGFASWAARSPLYVPDVTVVTIDDQPRGWWGAFAAVVSTSPAPRDAPSHRGWRASFGGWRSLLDRLSPWTPPIGLGTALVFCLEGSVAYLWAGLLWLGAIALLRTLALLGARPRIDGLWPALVLGDELSGAIARAWMRSPLAHGRAATPASSEGHLVNACFQALALGFLIAALAFAIDVLRMPPLGALTVAF